MRIRELENGNITWKDKKRWRKITQKENSACEGEQKATNNVIKHRERVYVWKLFIK